MSKQSQHISVKTSQSTSGLNAKQEEFKKELLDTDPNDITNEWLAEQRKDLDKEEILDLLEAMI